VYLGRHARTDFEQVGRYRLLAPIAAGGAATVYLGRAQGVGGFSRVVAVKVLHPHLAQEAGEFLEEAKLAARLRHPLIVPVVDVGMLDDAFYLVMEYVDGPSLSEVVRTADEVPLRVAGRVLVDVLEALDAAHSASDEKGGSLGVVHRDFSPQNILVGADGRSRLTDFGIARATTRAEYTRTGLIKGKVAYMAPEQATAEDLDARADVWAAGVVAWELLAGQRMYPRRDPVAVVLALTTKEPPPLRSVAPQLDIAVVRAVHWALQRDRNARCPTARVFREQLLEALDGNVASHDEVSDFVNGLTIPRLVGLRETIRADDDSVPPAEGFRRRALVAELPTVEQPKVEEGAGEQVSSPSAASTEFRLPLARSLLGRQPVVLAGVAAIVGLALLTWAFRPTRGENPRETTLASATTSASNRAPTRALPAELAAREADGPAKQTGAAPSVIQVAANEPIETIFVGERAVVLKGATQVATVELTDEEAKNPPSIRALAKDGREATGKPADESTIVELRFPEPRRDVANSPPTIPPPRPASTGELAPMPY
jgi:serine/threonine protein kinase